MPGHRGVDIGAPYGTDVYAGASGTVIFAGWDNGGLGNAVMILHPDGYTTVYAHNSEIFVSAGQEVNQGECIAAVGETGLAYGCHCPLWKLSTVRKTEPEILSQRSAGSRILLI